ncbi:MAG: hypothetical protein LBO06_00770 [Bacteroidales bacterium]|jgi:hypothetical protein|nr:hypothetical protein [Bacteroidales bacterium]
MKQTIIILAAFTFVGCCNTKKVVKEQKQSKIEIETNETINEQINTLVSTSINENEELVYTKIEFFPDDNVVVGAGLAHPEYDTNLNKQKNKLAPQQIKSIETLTKKNTKQTSQNIKQNSEMKQQNKEKIKANTTSKTTEIKETKPASNVKYYLLLFCIVIAALLLLKFRKWFNIKNK